MLAIFNLGGGEIILILAIVLILFGARKLPELARGLGEGIKEFKRAADTASGGAGDFIESTRAQSSRRLPAIPAETQNITGE